MTQVNKMVLIIKARNATEAREFAAVRGIPVTDMAEHELQFNSWRARTPTENSLKVQNWYNEDGDCLPGIGYPLGTLLYFNFGV